MNIQKMHRLIALMLAEFLFCLYLFNYIFADEPAHFNLINANKMNIDLIGNERVTTLTGDIDFFYNQIEFKSQNAQIFEKKEIVKLTNEVEIIDDTLKCTAHKAQYFKKKEMIYLQGNAVFTEFHSDNTIRTFKADKITYYRNKRLVIAKDNIISYDQREDITITGGYARYDINDGYGFLKYHPVLVHKEDEDTLIISSKEMEFFKNYEKLVATYNVRVNVSNSLTTSRFLIYFNKENKAILLGEPQFKGENSIASGEELQLYFSERELTEIHIKDNAQIFYSEKQKEIDKERDNYLFSDLIKIKIRDRKIKFLQAEGNVQARYEQEQTEKRDYAKNIIFGDTLRMFIDEEDRIDNIRANNRITGNFFFQKK